MFFFIKLFFQFCPSIVDCLIIELHSFIQFIFDEVTPVSRPGHRFDMLTRIILNRVVPYVVNFYCQLIYYCLFLYSYYLN